jgi:hypothetical protein
VLSTDDAVALFAKICGEDRVAQEPAVAREAVEVCGALPLAVRIAGARLSPGRTGGSAGWPNAWPWNTPSGPRP